MGEAGDSDEQKSLTGPREDRRLRSRRCFAFESGLLGVSWADDDGSRTTERGCKERGATWNGPDDEEQGFVAAGDDVGGDGVREK